MAKFDIKAHEEKMRAILNPPVVRPMMGGQPLPDLSKEIKGIAKKK